MIKNINNIIPERWEENGSLNGFKSAASKQLSGKTLVRKKAVSAVADYARLSGLSMDKVVTGVLKNAAVELSYYVQSEGEVPAKNWYNLAIQAALMRASEIAFISGSLGISDTEAIHELEASEQQVIEAGNPEGKQILTPETDAAILIVIDMLKGAFSKLTGSDKLPDFFAKYKKAVGSRGDSNNFGQTAPQFLYSPTGGSIGSKSPGMTSEGNISFPDSFTGKALANDVNNFVDPNDPIADSLLSGGSYTGNTDASGTTGVSTGTDWGSILNGISNVVNSVVGGIKTVGGTVTDTVNNVKDSVSNVGSDSISKSLQENLPLIIGAVVLVFALIFLAIYAAKSK
jgi:hypothetical protein